jgi:hypothetical protein
MYTLIQVVKYLKKEDCQNINGVRTYFTDSNNNVCCELGHLGNQDTSNGH